MIVESNTGNRTLEQRRAEHALNQINKLKNENGYGKLSSYVDALPAAILMNGLGQAMATELAGKNDKGHRKLYEAMQAWLCGEDEAAPYKGRVQTGLLQCIIDGREKTYLRAQAEALAYLVWLKKFARAFLEPAAED